MAEFATKGVAGTGLGLGIAGTALGLLQNGSLGGILGGNCCTSENMPVNRYEAGQSARIAELETEVKLRDANFYTLSEMGKLRDYVEHKFDHVQARLSQQDVVNAQVTANLSCMQGNIATLMGLTKTVVPISSICPEVMPRYNNWAAPTTEAATGT